MEQTVNAQNFIQIVKNSLIYVESGFLLKNLEASLFIRQKSIWKPIKNTLNI